MTQYILGTGLQFARRVASSVGEIVVLAVVIGTVPAGVAFMTWQELADRHSVWSIKGVPCEILDHVDSSIVGVKPPRTFDYGHVAFSHPFGEALCADIRDPKPWKNAHYTVCQFNNPGAITVTHEGRRVIFHPPVGQHATVTAGIGVLRCVVGGWFNY